MNNNSKKKVITINHVYKSFGNNIVLNDFNLELYQGENLVVLGKSGSGKSVLIKCIIGLLKIDAGEIWVFEKNIAQMNQKEVDNLRASVGFLFQSNALYDSMTVEENLALPLRRHYNKKSKAEIELLIKSALEEVGLLHTINMMPSELSGGMRKRIALARTLILQPKIILYDEPTTGLDPITAKEIIELIKKIQLKHNTSSLIITHDMNCVQHASNRVAILMNGKCYAVGSYKDLQNNQDPTIHQFFE